MSLKWILGGTCAGIGLGFVALFLSDDGKASERRKRKVTREQVLEVLKELRRELTSAFVSLASIAQTIKEEFGSSLEPELLREIIRSNSPVESQIRQIEEKVYKRWDTNEKEVRRAYQEEFLQDKEIQSIVKEMQEALEKAYRGIIPTMEYPLPEFVTPNFVLKVMSEIRLREQRLVYCKIQEAKDPASSRPPYHQLTSLIAEQIEFEKQKVFEKYALLHCEDAPSLVIHKAIEKYSRENKEFSAKLAQLETDYAESVKLIMSDSCSPEKIKQLETEDSDSGFIILNPN